MSDTGTVGQIGESGYHSISGPRGGPYVDTAADKSFVSLFFVNLWFVKKQVHLVLLVCFFPGLQDCREN